MTTSYDFRKRLHKESYKNIEIYRYNYFDACKKEEEVYNLSVKFSNWKCWWSFNTYEDSLETTFYNLQLLLELLTRFQDEMQISDKSIKYLLSAHEDLKLSYRFVYLWYYNTSWIHLRWFFEKMIHFIFIYFDDLWKIDDPKPFNLKDKINTCLKIWELSFKNIDNQDKDLYNIHYFPVWEILKLYKFYSNDYVHDWKPDSNLSFDTKEFKKIYFLINITLIYLPRFLKATIGDQIELYWKQEIFNPIEDYKYYRNYLQYMFGENKIFTNQYSEIYNLIHDDADNYTYAFEDLKLDTNNLFEKEYLDKMKFVNKTWKKAKWNREKYKDLMGVHYAEQNFKNNS